MNEEMTGKGLGQVKHILANVRHISVVNQVMAAIMKLSK